MILVNTDYITDKKFRTISIVRGSTIRAKHLGKDFMSGLKMVVGGELHAYQEMIDEARAQATQRMVKQAEELKADAVVNIRYTTSAVAQGAAEVLVYGTAVEFIQE